MGRSIETTRGGLTISTDQSRLDLDGIAEMLSRSYWARHRPRSVVERSLRNSLVFGVYDGTRQVGLARGWITGAGVADVRACRSFRRSPLRISFCG